MAAAKTKAKTDQSFDLVEEFKTKYAQVIEDVYVSVNHTAAEGWQNLYGQFRKTIMNRRQVLAEALKAIASDIARTGPNDETPKMLNDLKKEIEDIIETTFAFEASTVQPVKKPVDEASLCIDNFMAAAREEKRKTPLINDGIVDAMAEAVKASARASWDAETGVVKCVFPTASV